MNFILSNQEKLWRNSAVHCFKYNYKELLPSSQTNCQPSMFSENWLQNIQEFNMQTETLMSEMTQFKAAWEHTVLKYTHLILCWEILNV